MNRKDSRDLARLRTEIAKIDKAIIDLLQSRMIFSLEVGDIKVCNGISILQREVQNKVEERFVLLGKKACLDPKFTRPIICRITAESCKEQYKLKKRLKKAIK